MIQIDDYLSLRLIMWSFPHKQEISRQDAHEMFAAQWEYFYVRSMEGHEVALVNDIIQEFGPIVPRYRSFHIYGNYLPYTYGKPIYRLVRPATPKTILVALYPQLHASVKKIKDIIEMPVNDAFMWYTEYWTDLEVAAMEENEKSFLEELIYEFGPIFPDDKDGNLADPIISIMA